MSKGVGKYAKRGSITERHRKQIEFALHGGTDYIINKVNVPRIEREAPKTGLLPPGLYQRGYGRSEYWPFSIKKAVSEHGYRRGVIRAQRNPAYNAYWRSEADRYLTIVYEIIAGTREPMEVLHFSK